jgi:nucleotide-binding universal stress UspA family protein
MLLRQMSPEPASVLAPLMVLLPGQGSPQFSKAQMQRLAGQELQRFLDSAVGEHGETPTTVLRTGDPVEEILAELAASETDLAVLGSHARGGFERHTLGSVAGEIACAASCSVLVVPLRPALDEAPAQAAEERAHPVAARP